MKTRVAYVLVILLGFASPVTGQTSKAPKPKPATVEFDVNPDQLPRLLLDNTGMFIDKDIDVYLINGGYYQGRVTAMTKSDLVVKVKKALPKSRLATPRTSIPIGEISTIQFLTDRKTSSLRKSFGVEAGGAASFALAPWLLSGQSNDGKELVFLSAAFALPLAGEWLAWKRPGRVTLHIDHLNKSLTGTGFGHTRIRESPSSASTLR